MRDVPLRREKKILQRRGREADRVKRLQARANGTYRGEDTVKEGKMGFPTIFSCRQIVVKVFLVQFIAFQATYAAPSPIIRFPGDDTPKTDKEVALVSLCIYCTEILNQSQTFFFIFFIFYVCVSPLALSE